MSLLVQQGGGENGVADAVRVHVAAGPAVLQVALLGIGHAARNAHAGAAIGNSPAELVDGGRLEAADEPALVVLATAWVVRLDVLRVLLRQLDDRFLDGLDAALLAHSVGREVSVTACEREKSISGFPATKARPALTSSVPAAFHRFRIEGHYDAELFCDAPQNIARDPKVIGGLHAERWADLVFCGGQV